MGDRQNPAKAQMARAGNYVADVDTAGMDPEMKKTLGIGQPKPAKQPSLFDKMLGWFNHTPPPQKKPAPIPEKK